MSVSTLSFEFGGRVSLDFTWTLRYRSVRPTELLTVPGRLGEWLTANELPSGRVTIADLEAALVLREAIYATANQVIADTPLETRHLRVINRWAGTEHASPQLRPDGSAAVVVPRGKETAAALTTIACDAINLFSNRDQRLKRCEGDLCSLLFHDTSRPGTRRWCSAERCGNRVNTKNYRTRLEAQ